MNPFKKAVRYSAFVMVLALLLSGCSPAGSPTGSSIVSLTVSPAGTTAESTALPAPSACPYQDASLPVEQRVSDLLGRMTLAEKAGQMVQGERGAAAPAAVTKYALGSVLSGGGSVPGDGKPEAWLNMNRAYQQAALKCRLPIPLLYGIDAVHGHNNAVGAVVFPHNIGLGAANSPELMEQMGQAVADELYATGIPWTFAPCLATVQDPRWGRTYESLSSDPAIVSALSLPFSRGLMKGGAIPTLKHYVADGGTAWGTSKVPGFSIDQGDAVIDEKTLRDIHLMPYVAQIKAGVPVVMASFSSWNGVKMHANKYLLTDVLKGELGFNGFVVSDWNGLQQLDGAAYEDKVAACVNAGVDMLMETDKFFAAVNAIVEDVKDGKITEALVNDAVSRILRVKFNAGLFEDPYLEKAAAAFGTGEHRALAAQLVSKSLVLLKNDKGMLPFKKGQKILVTGPAANDLGVQCGGWTLTWQGWMGDNRQTTGTTILDGLKTEAAKAGAEILTNSVDAGQADVILLVIGERPYAEGQGDCKDISLTGKMGLKENQQSIDFARSTGKPVAALIVAGRQPIITNELPGWDAAVMAYLPGTEGQGVAPVLFGKTDFQGKLPMPWYGRVEDIGKAGVKPLFPLGYGLTYKK